MKTVAVPHWQGRVSPVFDVAGNVLIVDIDAATVGSRRDLLLLDESPHNRAALLARSGAEVLICGAISWPLQMAVAAAGIEVIPQICGDIDKVLAAYAAGRLVEGAFLMPGCCGRRRRSHGRRGCGFR